MAGQVLYPVSPYQTRPYGITPPGSMPGMGGAIGGVMNAIHPMQVNQPQVDPGTDAQGNPTINVTPASLGGGFINRLIAGRQGQMQINQINSQLQQAKLNALAGMMQEREHGAQERKTKITDAQVAILQNAGLMPRTTPQGDAINADLINKYAGETEASGLATAGKKAEIGDEIAGNTLHTMQSPEGQKAMTEANLGQILMPAFGAQKASQVSATPGETVAYNRPGNLTGSIPDLLRGALTSSTQSTPMLVPPTKDANGKLVGGGIQVFPTGSTDMQPGGLQQNLMQQASQLPPSPDGSSPAADLSNPPQQPSPMGTVLQLPGSTGQPQQQPVTSQDSNIPVKPSPLTPYPGYGPYAGTTASVSPYADIANMIKNWWQAIGNVPQASGPFDTSPVQ